jgi:penicillin amidase
MRARAARPPISVAAVAAAVVLSLAVAVPPGEATTIVKILRDPAGVPHVRSGTDLGAFYGLGWATAEDRLLHMNLNVWAVQGRMAEALGSDWVAQDRYFRTVGMWRHAQEVAQNLDQEHRALLTAYSDGVNDWLAAHQDDVNVLFAELGMEPETWTPAHCLGAWWRVANLFISDPFKKASSYYEFMDLVGDLGMEPAIEEFLGDRHPGDPDAGVVQVEDVPQEVQDAIHDYADSMGYGDDAKGFAKYHPDSYGHSSPSFSHAWVVGGERTTTGKAVLVSDPQITVTFPNLFYEWHASGASFAVRGIGVPGAAGLLIGFNGHLAWGLTAAGADQRDLMRIEMTERDTYQVDGVEHTVEKETETILVEGAEDETVTWRRSLWGPIVTPLVDEARPGDEFALNGVPYCDPDRDTFTAMVAMMRARDMDAFRAALDDWRFPSANVVAGDDQGNIFFTLLGALPVRSIESPLGGLIAQEGSSLDSEWQDTIPGKYKPWVLNPQEGYVLSANHRAAGEWYPARLGTGFIGTGDTVRSRRLREVLSALPPVSSPAEILQASQYDCVNAAKRDMVAILRHARDVGGVITADAASALDHLDDWSAGGGSVLTASPGVFLVSKIDTMFRAVTTGEALNDLYGGGQGGLNLFLKMVTGNIAQDPEFQPDADTVTFLDNALAGAWRDAMAVSSDPGGWDQLYEQSQSATPRLDWFSGAYLLGSGYDSGYSYTPPTLQCEDGATIWSQRGEAYTQFVDLAAVDDSLSVIPPGNTEGPDDAYWQAKGTDWADGVLDPAPLTDAAVDAIAVDEVTLYYQAGDPLPHPRHPSRRLQP